MPLTQVKGSVIDRGVYVTDYGAVGDGTTDDTAAIQAAIDAGAGEEIYFPAGNYRVSSTLTVSANGTNLRGAGTGQTYITQVTVDIDTFYFAPTTAGTTSDFLSNCRIEGMNIAHGAVAASHTSGAGIRFTQVNGSRIYNLSINDAAEGIVVEGGQLNSLKSVAVNAVAGSNLGGDSALLHFMPAAVGAGFDPMYTTHVEDFRLSASKLRTSCIRVANADGLVFTDGYVANGATSLVDIKAKENDDKIGALRFIGVYLDCISQSTGTPNGIRILNDAGLTGVDVYNLDFGSGCQVGNCGGDAIFSDHPDLVHLHLNGARVTNVLGWGINLTGGANTKCTVSGSYFNNIGTAATSGAISLDTGETLTIAGNTFNSVQYRLVELSGTWDSGTITGNSCADTSIGELENSATFTNPLVVSGNSTSSVTSTSLGGLRLPNADIASDSVLDWYEQGSGTPAITFGGANVGMTTSTADSRYTRIGNVVFFQADIVLTAKGSSTGSMEVSLDVPYNAATSVPSSTRVQNMTSGVGDSALTALLSSQDDVRVYKHAAGALVQLTDADLQDNSRISVSGHYEVQ